MPFQCKIVWVKSIRSFYAIDKAVWVPPLVSFLTLKLFNTTFSKKTKKNKLI